MLWKHERAFYLGGILSIILWGCPSPTLSACLASSRNANSTESVIPLRSFLCTPDDGSAEPQLRVEFHRLSDMAASTLVSNGSFPFMHGALGPVSIIRNEVYEVLRELVTRFGEEITAFPLFTVSSPISDKTLGGDDGNDNNIGNDGRTTVISISPKEYVYGRGSGYIKGLQSLEQLHHYWNKYYRTRNFSEANSYHTDIIFWRQLDPQKALSFVKPIEKYLISKGCFNDGVILFYDLCPKEPDCSGCGLHHYTKNIVLDIMLIENVSATASTIQEVHGLQNSRSNCQADLGFASLAETFETPIWNRPIQLAPRQRLVIPLKITLAEFDVVKHMASDIKEARSTYGKLRSKVDGLLPGSFIDIEGGIKLQKEMVVAPTVPRPVDYVLGPEWELKRLRVNNESLFNKEKYELFELER